MNLMRVWAIVLRHAYAFRYNVARLMEIVFWPFFELLVWGFLAVYVRNLTGASVVLAVILSAILLWNIFFRVQNGINVSFLMELWSRNLTNIFVSPISVTEYLAGLMVVGLLKVAVVGIFMWGAALLLYHVNVLTVGIALVPLALALILFAWAVGLVTTAVILRFGQGAEVLAWAIAFFLQPFGAVFWPLETYPDWLASIVWWLPLAHIFEALRSLIAGEGLPTNHLVWAYGLDTLYLTAAFLLFGYMFEQAREKGYLLKAQD